jgi:hypothetical protein
MVLKQWPSVLHISPWPALPPLPEDGLGFTLNQSH